MSVKKIFVFSLFAVAMAYLESAIVVYLRLLYYPSGFRFPMIPIPSLVAAIEIGREVATLIMLWVVVRMAGQNFRERFALFCFTFGVWDLFYYFWLKVFLNWPGSWLEWDILFLIPLPWIGPWLTPALVSIGLIIVSVIILIHPQRFPERIFNRLEWIMVITGGAIILASFFWQTGNVLEGRIPDYYPWWLFFTGYLLGISVFIHAIYKKQ